MSGGRKLAYLVATAISFFPPNHSILDRSYGQAYAEEAHAMVSKENKAAIRIPETQTISVRPNSPPGDLLTEKKGYEGLCTDYSVEQKHKITKSDFKSALLGYDEGKGDPFVYAVFHILQDAKKDTCYLLTGDDVRAVFTQMSPAGVMFNFLGFNSFTYKKDGETHHKTIAPIEELVGVSAKTGEKNINAILTYTKKQVGPFSSYSMPKELSLDAKICGANKDYILDITQTADEKAWVAEKVTSWTGIGFDTMRINEGKYPNINLLAQVLNNIDLREVINVDREKANCEKSKQDSLIKKEN